MGVIIGVVLLETWEDVYLFGPKELFEEIMKLGIAIGIWLLVGVILYVLFRFQGDHYDFVDKRVEKN
ncbi:MAG: hypothetical protein NUV91_06335 [Candidatus Omnitrophica bacterium]|nr:hypothetical protein [Candidatus Omnitrophota bacterium]